jgi:transcriptional regulator with XRE-family HTH domain
MTNQQESTSDRVVLRVQQIRKYRGWNAARLAEECARHGHPEVTEQVIYNLEQRRRKEVSVDQLEAFAFAFQMSPVVLLGPLGGPDQHLVEVPLHFDSSEAALDFLQKINTLAGSLRASIPDEQEGGGGA